jgi:hypothetical protein
LQSAEQQRPRVALLGTVVHKHSHAQHFLDRLVQGYAYGGQWHAPRVEVASIYLDQFPDNDLGRQRIKRYRLRQFPTIAEALTLGTGKLAVDGVVIIAEHGDYPKNDKGQKLYPRYQWFAEVVKVFEASGRSVPVFNDKHLSTSWDECAQMVAAARRLKFPLLAGSSLPVTRRLPAIDMPYDAELRESVCVAYGGIDTYDIHAYETAQCMSERRRGGEVGIASVQALRGAALWKALDADDRDITRKLIVAALSRSHNLPVDGGYPTDPVTYDWAKRTLHDPLGLLVAHRDGFRTTVLLTNVYDFNYAGWIGGESPIVSCQMYLPMPGQGATTADFFTPLVRHIEQMVLTGEPPYPAERTLLTSGMVIAGVDSVHQGGKLIETPQVAVKYQAPRASTFWQE